MKKQKKSIPMIAFTVDMQENGLHTYVMNVKEKKLINYLNGYAHALQSAYQGLSEGGIPIGAALIVEDEVVATGYNKRVQMNSSIRHGETDCIENAGRLSSKVYSKSVLYTTLSPCTMCAGTILLYKIPTVVIGENETFQESESWLKSNGVNLIVLDDFETKTMFQQWCQDNPDLWNEDIGI
jgi:cytosine deaminase